MKKLFNLLFVSISVLVFMSCSGDDEGNGNPGGAYQLNDYRVEVDFDGDQGSYLTQVIIRSHKDRFATDDDYIDIMIDGTESMKELTDGKCHLLQSIRSGEIFPGHNYIFGTSNTFETVEKAQLVTVVITCTALYDPEVSVPGQLTANVRVYRDDRLIRETDHQALGHAQQIQYTEQFDSQTKAD